MGDIEEHLGVTIQQVEKDLKIAVDEFDGKVVYGAKRKDTGSGNTYFVSSCCHTNYYRTWLNLDVWYDKIFVLGYVGHADQLAPTLKELTRLEKESQNLFLHRFYNTQLPA